MEYSSVERVESGDKWIQILALAITSFVTEALLARFLICKANDKVTGLQRELQEMDESRKMLDTEVLNKRLLSSGSHFSVLWSCIWLPDPKTQTTRIM